MTDRAIVNEHRPLSPHLQVYRPQISSTLSILHRITGFALSMGSFVLALWLWSAAYNAELFAEVNAVLGSVIGQIALIGWSWCFYYHLGAGIRHLFWDAGKGFEINFAAKTGWLVVLFSFAATAGTWVYIYMGGS
jgi:succinate dehydrogenase / fumarate reductase cytochrome b subunit